MQAGILAAAGILVRIIGLLYGSPLTGIIGDEGNGYYSQAYNIYTIMLLISSYSIPSAISKVIAQKLGVGEVRNAQRIFRAALIYVMVVGGFFALLLFFGADHFVEGSSIPVLRVFAPTIFFFGFLGVLRGYFQAHKTMVPTSISQIIEQICNAVISLSAAYLLMQMVRDRDQTTQAIYGAMGSAVGTGSGVIAALIFMFIMYMRQRGEVKAAVRDDVHPVQSYRSIYKMIFLIVTPFILSTCIYNLTTVVNQTLFTRIMIYGKGLPEKDVATAYGIFSRKAVVIANIPIAIASAMSSAMMPNISSSFAQGKKQETADMVSKVIRMTMLIAIPSAIGLIALAKPVMMVLYPQRASLDEASMLLAGMGITVIFYSLSTISNSVLQGIGKVNAPVINAAISLLVQSGVLAVLLTTTNLGNKALVIAVIIYSFLMCVLNDLSARKGLTYERNVTTTYVKPLLASLIMGIGARLIYDVLFLLFGKVLGEGYFANLLAAGIAIVLAVLIYMAVLIRIKGVKKEELAALPKGRSIVRILKKCKLL